VEVSIPSSSRGDPRSPTTTPPGTLLLVSDTVDPQGSRTCYYTAAKRGTAIVTSMVTGTTNGTPPVWLGLVKVA
jgi:hypothetical protein